MGPEGFQARRHLPAHRDRRRRRGLGALRLREDARLPLGHLPRRRRARTARSASATTSASRPGRRCPASSATRCAASSSPRATPSRPSVEQQRLLGTTAPEPLRPAQPLPGQRRGGPPPLGDGLPAPHATSAATAARRPRTLLRAPLRRRRQAAHPRRVQRADRRLALLLHVHDVHRPRRQVPARWRWPRAASTRSRAPRASCSPRRRTTCSWARPGVGRVVQRTCELMKRGRRTATSRAQGGIDLDTIQKYLNFWYSRRRSTSSAARVSSNAADYFAAGPQGPLPGGASSTRTTWRSTGTYAHGRRRGRRARRPRRSRCATR